MTPALAAAIQEVVDLLANHPAVLVRGPVERLRAAMEASADAGGTYIDNRGHLRKCRCRACMALRAGFVSPLRPESVV